MKIKELTIRNYKRFVTEQNISFCNPNGQINDITLLLGTNGSGKTSILQLIAALVGSAVRKNMQPDQLEWSGYNYSFLQNGNIGKVETNTLRLEVATIPIRGDSIQIAPIKPIIEEPRTFEDFIPYLIPLLILIVIGCMIYLIVNRKKPPKVVVPEKPLLPHELALQKLVALQQQKLWQKGDVKPYQSELTFIIREYLENRFNIQALESTTDEIVQNLRKVDLEERWRDRLQELFINADLVKFAKAQPPMSIHEQGMNDAIAFVEATKPVIQVSETV